MVRVRKYHWKNLHEMRAFYKARHPVLGGLFDHGFKEIKAVLTEEHVIFPEKGRCAECAA